jgi:hypothetical protein
MTGFLTIIGTLPAFVLLGCGIYAAVCQIALHFDAMQDDDDFGDVHSEEY